MTGRYRIWCPICGQRIHEFEKRPPSYAEVMVEIDREAARSPASTLEALIGSAAARLLRAEADTNEEAIRDHLAADHPLRLRLFDRFHWRWLIRGIPSHWWPVGAVAGFALATAVFAAFEFLESVQIP